jgi:hypothetical protein
MTGDAEAMHPCLDARPDDAPASRLSAGLRRGGHPRLGYLLALWDGCSTAATSATLAKCGLSAHELGV